MPSVSAAACGASTPVAQATEDAEQRASSRQLRIGRDEWHPELGRCRETSCRSGITPTIVAGWPLTRRVRANDLRVAAEAVLPEVVADDDDRFGAATVVAGREVAPEERLLAAARRSDWP